MSFGAPNALNTLEHHSNRSNHPPTHPQRDRRFGFPALEFGLLDVLVKLRSFPRQPGLPPDIEDVTGFGAGDTASEF